MEGESKVGDEGERERESESDDDESLRKHERRSRATSRDKRRVLISQFFSVANTNMAALFVFTLAHVCVWALCCSRPPPLCSRICVGPVFTHKCAES